MAGSDIFMRAVRSNSSMISLRSWSAKENSSVPASIFERSRMSPTSCNSKALLFLMMLRYSFFSSSSCASASSSEKPTIAFSGVRISWLILARNALLSVLLRSASSLAMRRDSSICFWAVMTRAEPINCRRSPLISYLGMLLWVSSHSYSWSLYQWIG